MNLLQDLTAVGFTEYEAKVYLALLRENPATGYQLSKNSGVPRSMVYEALGRLVVRGAVLKTDDRRATLYRPVPPEILLDRYQKEHDQLFDNLRKELGAMVDTQQEDYYWTFKGSGSVFSYARQMIEKAQAELLVVLNDTDLGALRPQIETACRRGVLTSALLTGSGELGCGDVVRHPPLESELQELDRMMVLVVDNQQVLIANRDHEVTATITRNMNLVLIARQFVWMELFAQRIYSRMGPDLLQRLDPDDRRILEVYGR
jgi:HTH-type transcriptional regulator, sugar sensing transcriptional regulator